MLMFPSRQIVDDVKVLLPTIFLTRKKLSVCMFEEEKLRKKLKLSLH